MTTLKWINDKYFEEILRNYGVGHDIKIINTNVAEASPPSDNSDSTVLKAKVEYSSSRTKHGTVHLIVKLSLNRKNAFVDGTTFSTEVKMYQTIKEIQRLFETSGENVDFAPRLLYYSEEPIPNIVLEDVSVPPKLLTQNSERLDFDETKKITMKLARWHAASYHLAGDSKLKLHEYNIGLFNLNSEGLNSMHNNFRLFADEVKTWPGYERYAEKLELLTPKFLQYGKRIYQASGPNNGYNVLNHGDFNYKNMLFKKHDANHKVHDALFVDFQLSIWGTPAIDIYNLLYTVASDETRLKYENELLVLYHTEFVDTLRRIGLMAKPPTILELRVELMKHKFLEAIIAICFLPYFYADNSRTGHSVYDDAKIEERKKLYQNPAYQNTIKQILPGLLTSGALY